MKTPQERLGSFYLGAEYDLQNGKVLDTKVHYDARDLTTHAVCVGMTGSGKTGLCVGLLEEAALDRVPTIMIDPKGDITNLLLQFPDLRPDDFKPWINPDDAGRKGMSVDDYAASTAETWKKGLDDWGIGPERIRRLKASADFTIYTPGSDAGVPVNILGSLAAPKLDVSRNAEAIREQIGGTVGALMGLAGLKSDPVKSPEAILLSGIFEHFWMQGQDLDLAKLILSIQEPPMKQVGVFDTDTFFPPKERFELAMSFNSLMASPGFRSWLQGEALDIDRMLFTAEGRPRHSIFYLAHLTDSERMFFVTLLLENMLTWMRSQTGTTSLRALLYFDEVFGFLPPVAEPPSKRPLMTLLKQARAFGLGCVLVTQNPVDIDYKGLTNAGTWFIGKLQAERDKARVLEGLKNAIAEAGGAGGAVDYDSIITGLGSRVFLMHNVHEDRPVVFHTRWAMSYLRGPLTRPQVRRLMESKTRDRDAAADLSPLPRAAVQAAGEHASPGKATETTGAPEGYLEQRPALDPSVNQCFLPLLTGRLEASIALEREASNGVAIEDVSLLYEPAILGLADVHFVDTRRNIRDRSPQRLLLRIRGENVPPDWKDAEKLTVPENMLETAPAKTADASGPFFAPPPSSVNSAKELSGMSKKLADWLYYNERRSIAVHDELKLFQHPDESMREFTIRLRQAAREKRDEEVEGLKEKLDRRLERLETKLRREERELSEDEIQLENRKRQELFSIGETVLGFFMGKRSTSRIGTVLNKRGMTARAKADLEESREEIDEIREDIAELEEEMKEKAEEIGLKWENAAGELGTDELAPRRADVDIHSVSLAWLPVWSVNYREGAVEKSRKIEAFRSPA